MKQEMVFQQKQNLILEEFFVKQNYYHFSRPTGNWLSDDLWLVTQGHNPLFTAPPEILFPGWELQI